MKKAYVAPKLNASMNGTLEGVYACYDENCSNKNHPYCDSQPECGGYFAAIGWSIEISYGRGHRGWH